jgi:hypothetical protein
MAVRWAVDTKEYERGSLYKFNPEEIVVEPAENGRHVDPDIEWMIADIHARGQETPVTVRSDGGKPVLVFGYQRLRAIKAINERWPDEPKRKVTCIFKQLSKEEAFRANIAENRMRNEVSPIDDAHNIKRLMNVYGYTDEKVIEAYFPNLTRDTYEGLAGSWFKDREDAKRWVRERMALIGLTPAAEKAVREGRVKLSGAIELNKLPAQKQDEVVGQGKGWVKAKDVRKAANKPAPTPRKKSEGTFTINAKGEYVPPPYVPTKAVKDFAKREGSKLFNLIAAQDEDEDEQDMEEDICSVPIVESVQNLASEMLSALSESLWNPDRDKKPRPELLEMADSVMEAAAQASATYDFPSEVLNAMESYRIARVKK